MYEPKAAARAATMPKAERHRGDKSLAFDHAHDNDRDHEARRHEPGEKPNHQALAHLVRVEGGSVTPTSVAGSRMSGVAATQPAGAIRQACIAKDEGAESRGCGHRSGRGIVDE